MAIAIILHGNVRTFFMPLREDNSIRICDLFYSNIVKPNKADLFVVTDTTDFYFNGVQYFEESQKDKIKDKSSAIFYDANRRGEDPIDFMDSGRARELLSSEINGFLGDSIRAIDVQDPMDVTENTKFVLLSNSPCRVPERISNRVKGCVPMRIVNQYHKIKSAYDLLQKHEHRNGVHYDLVFRGRFDNIYGRHPLSIPSFDYKAHDVFVPGWGGPIVYDWCAFGTRWAMDLALNMYDRLGFTLASRMYRCECKGCGSVNCGDMIGCKCNGEMEYEEISLSSEYHLYRLFKDNNIKYASSG